MAEDDINDLERLARAREGFTFYTVEEAAEMLRITPRTLRNLLNTGAVPGVRLGGQWRLTREAIAWLQATGAPPQTPMPEDVGLGDAKPDPTCRREDRRRAAWLKMLRLCLTELGVPRAHVQQILALLHESESLC